MPASLRDLLPPLSEVPSDVPGEAPISVADQVLYRLGLRALPVPGLPPHLVVGDVMVDFFEGPIRAQQTAVRQRHALPPTFDKHMSRPEVGQGELVALLSIRSQPVPKDVDAALEQWRARAFAAAGLIASILDERVVGEELFEDAVFLAAGAYAGAIDRRANVPSYLPFEVSAADRAALEDLAPLTVEETSRTARAARLYRRASIEGPTADAYAMLWVAAECFSDRRTPSRQEIEEALLEAGINPEGLPLHVGLLIGLRGRVQHQGFEDLETLRMAFYEMEAVVRVLIRRDLRITAGWWPARGPQAFAEPFDKVAAAAMGPGATVWHSNALPPVGEPEPLRIPRRVARPWDDPRVDLDPALGENLKFVAGIVVDALEWFAPDITLSVYVSLPVGAPADRGMAAGSDALWIPDDRLVGLDDSGRPELLVNFVWDLVRAVGAAIAQRAGVVSEGDGAMIVEAFGARAQYLKLAVHGPFDPDLLAIPVPDNPFSQGKLVGWASAGDQRARSVIEAMPNPQRALCRELATSLRSFLPGPPVYLLG